MLAPNSPLVDGARRHQNRLQESAAVNPIRVFGNRSSCIYTFFLANMIILAIASLIMFIVHGRHHLFNDYAYGFYYLVIIILMLIYKPIWIPFLLMLNYKCGCASIHKAKHFPCIYKAFNYFFWGTIGNPIVSFSPMFIWSYYIFVAVLNDKAIAVRYEVAVLIIMSWMCLLVVLSGLLIMYQISVDTNFVITYVQFAHQRPAGIINSGQRDNNPLFANTSDIASNASQHSQHSQHSRISNLSHIAQNADNPANPDELNIVREYVPNQPNPDNFSLNSVVSSVSDIDSQLIIFRRSDIDNSRPGGRNFLNFNERVGGGYLGGSNYNSASNLLVAGGPGGTDAARQNSLAVPDAALVSDDVLAQDVSMGGGMDTLDAEDVGKKETLGAVQVSEKLQAAQRTKSKMFLGDWFSLTKSLVIMLNQNEDECAICFGTYEDDDIMAELVCKHQFHRTCITNWLLQNPTCPICRTRVIKA